MSAPSLLGVNSLGSDNARASEAHALTPAAAGAESTATGHPPLNPAALAGGADVTAVPILPSAGPAESAGHSVHLLPTQTHPRYLTLIKDSQQPNWWYAYLCDRDQHPLAYCSSWTKSPRIVRMSACIVLRLDNAQLDISKEEMELLRPLTAHGLVIEEAAS